MNERPPYSMAQFATEVVALDDARVEYGNPDGLGVYQEARIASDQPGRWLDVLTHVSGIDRRLQKVDLDDPYVVVTFTASGGRWTRDTFHLDAMWAATEPDAEPDEKPVKKPRKRTTKKATD